MTNAEKLFGVWIYVLVSLPPMSVSPPPLRELLSCWKRKAGSLLPLIYHDRQNARMKLRIPSPTVPFAEKGLGWLHFPKATTIAVPSVTLRRSFIKALYGVLNVSPKVVTVKNCMMTNNKPITTSGGLHYFLRTHGDSLGQVKCESDEAKFLKDLDDAFKPKPGEVRQAHVFDENDGLWYDLKIKDNKVISRKPLPFDCPSCDEQTLELNDERNEVHCTECGYEHGFVLKTKDDQ